MNRVPRVLINLKAYPQALGDKSVMIAKVAEEVWKETGVLVGIAPNLVDLSLVAKSVEIPVFSQHVDPFEVGARTGHVVPMAIKEVGASGSLINHSEKQVKLRFIKESVDMLRTLGLTTIVCSPTPEESAAVSALGPSAIAIEPPELIGTGISVSRAKPEIVTDSVRAVMGVNPKVKVLCGAGITSREDVKAAIELGSYGVLVASAIVKSPKPKEKILELVGPFQSVI